VRNGPPRHRTGQKIV
jgi:hypothetical protein